MDFEFLKIITFEVKGRCFALPSNNVKEIIDTLDSVKDVRYGGDILKGVMNFDGNLISVLDLPALLDMHEDESVSMIIACKDKDMDASVAMLISSIKGIETIGMSSVTPSQDDDVEYIQGFLREDENVALLDLKKLLDYAGTRIDSVNHIFDVSDYN
ncbi:MAG: chemotaxis protein CheW [Proteobacteria bacterium]|nr:chemotaxis protein CheW [Pseudomonadota bacterium]